MEKLNIKIIMETKKILRSIRVAGIALIFALVILMSQSCSSDMCPTFTDYRAGFLTDPSSGRYPDLYQVENPYTKEHMKKVYKSIRKSHRDDIFYKSSSERGN